MRLYLSGLTEWGRVAFDLIPPDERARLGLLATFAYADRELWPTRYPFLDSGAFTYQGKAYPTEGFYAWAAKLDRDEALICSPDVIGDGAASCDRAEHMLKHRNWLGKVLPVFHVGSDWKHLERCVALSDYIAFGGMVQWLKNNGSKRLSGWCAEAFQRVNGRARVHGFGVTFWDLLLRHPWASVDSATWLTPGSMGNFPLFDPVRLKQIRIYMREPRKLAIEGELLRSYGLDPASLVLKERGSSREVMCPAIAATARSALAMVEYVTERRARVANA